MVPNTTGSPENSGNLVEGWRAVLAVIQRHGLSSTGTGDEELEGVEAMVARVKSKGVRMTSTFWLGRVSTMLSFCREESF